MKKVVFVTQNRQLIEKVNAALSSRIDLDIQLLSTSRYRQALSDIKMFGADIVVVHAEDDDGIEAGIELCELLQNSENWKCKKIFLIDSNIEVYNQVKQAKEDGFIHEWVVCDESLKPLFSTLSDMKEYQNEVQ